MIEPFEVLLERESPAYRLPATLARIYGRLGFGDQTLYANFVSSLDGVVTLGAVPSAGSVISGRNAGDRFLMGLLRACADAVVIGAGTLRATPGHRWTPDHVAPSYSAEFAELRSDLGRRPEPRLVVLSAGGPIDIAHVAIQNGATIVTTERNADQLAARLPASCDVIGVGSGTHVDLGRALDALRSRDLDVLLTEGGPHVMGELIRANLVDEIFLTLSPVIAGRATDSRLGMVAGAELLPDAGAWSGLVSVRSHGDHVFLRYRQLRE